MSTPPMNQMASQVLKPGYGLPCKPSRFTAKSSGKIREILTVMLTNYPLNVSRFITLSLPTTEQEVFACVENCSSFIVGKLSTHLRRKYPGSQHLWRWEYQQRGALHLNIVIAFPNRVPDQFGEEMLSWWMTSLSLVMFKAGIDADLIQDITPSENTCWIKEPCASLPGYLAKSAQSNPRIRPDGQVVSPSRWYGASQDLYELLKRSTYHTSILCSTEADQERVVNDLSTRLHPFSKFLKPLKDPYSGSVIGATMIATDPAQSVDVIAKYSASERSSNRPDGKTILEEIAEASQTQVPHSKDGLRQLYRTLCDQPVTDRISFAAQDYLEDLESRMRDQRALVFPLDYVPLPPEPAMPVKARIRPKGATKKNAKQSTDSKILRPIAPTQARTINGRLDEINKQRHLDCANRLAEALGHYREVYCCDPSLNRLAKLAGCNKRTAKKFLKESNLPIKLGPLQAPPLFA